MPPNFSTGQRFPSVLQHCWLGERNGTILSCQVCPKVLSGKMEKTWAETWLTQVHTNNSHLNHVLLVDILLTSVCQLQQTYMMHFCLFSVPVTSVPIWFFTWYQPCQMIWTGTHAQAPDTCTVRPMSHLRFYRATLLRNSVAWRRCSVQLRTLHNATLSHKQTKQTFSDLW